MGVYYISNVYNSVVDEKAQGYLKGILEKSPESRKQAQQDLCALIESEIEGLRLKNIPEGDANKKLYLLRQATFLTTYLEHPDQNVLMPILRQIAKEKITEKEVIEKAKSMGIGANDKNAIYIA